jgi:ubiquinone/menaquinone biosynthesis C-methylase UbiE
MNQSLVVSARQRNRSLSRFATDVAYVVRQLWRVGWYFGHNLVLRRLSKRARRRSGRPRPHTDAPTPDRKRVFKDMAALFGQDLANVEAGLYPPPADHDGSLGMLLKRSRLFFEDLPKVHRRRENDGRFEVLTAETRGKRPLYYLQNFHFQSGGWMTEDSARLYDTQVEIFFNGTVNATRRQALPPLYEVFAGREQHRLRLLDVGCGTGRFLDFAKQAWPELSAAGLDMSEAYIKEAKLHLERWAGVELVVGNGERLPLQDESHDAVCSIFVFHELPPDVRRTFFREFARVLKPGGRLVIVDSIQSGDASDYEGLIELFPQSFHEPYFTTYAKENFGALGEECGLIHTRDVRAFVSKVMVFDKPVEAIFSANKN